MALQKWLVICVAALALKAQAATLERIAAVVNAEVITQGEVASRAEQALRQLRAQQGGQGGPSRAQVEKQVLERLISDRVQIQRARQLGIAVDEGTLDRAVARIAEQNNLSLSQFRNLLEKQEGISWSRFREDIRGEILMSRLREREVDSRVVVSDAEVESALAAPAGMAGAREFQLAHIFLRSPDNANAESWMRLSARAAEVQRLVRQGDDFAKLAAAFSDAQDAMQGGLMEWRTIERLPANFAEEVVKLQPGQVSSTLRSPTGLHIVKLLGARDPQATANIAVQQTRARHILLKTADVLGEADAKRRLGELRARIVRGDKFEEVARMNSSDSSAAQGGDLGWLSAGETVPDFERAMDALKPGELSEVVATPFGWHLIQVLERRQQDLGPERRRLQVRQALRERKSEEAAEVWVKQLRDEAFVEIRRNDDL